MKAKEKSSIEILLGQWGAWRRRENSTALGYPSSSAFTTFRVDGQRQADPTAFLVDDDMRKLDREIERIHPEFRAVLVQHYVRPGVVKGKHEALGISRSLYFFRLEFATKQLDHLFNFEPQAEESVACAATI